MKKILPIILLLFLAGCSKDEENTPGSLPNNNTGTASVSLYIDGVAATADSSRGYISIDTSLGIPIRAFMISIFSQNRVIIPGFADTINSMTVGLVNYTDPSSMIQYYAMNDTVNTFNSYQTTFRITSSDAVNKKVTGTFSGILVGDVTHDTIRITNGTFTNLHYEPL